jgi:glyoxalase family protein
MLLTGIHHITAIASNPQPNVDFYVGVLGLRLVKRTVNFDDPGTYHLYFGNQAGRPGSILTFFPWPGARRGTVGAGQVTATSFAIPRGSIDYWRERLEGSHAGVDDGAERFGEAVLRFEDPDGLPLELVESAAADPASAWTGARVAPEHAIGGFHSATIAEEGYEQTAQLLQDTMGLRAAGSEGNRFRYVFGDGRAAGTVVDVLCQPDGRPGRLGAGTVHHIAWRTPNDEQQARWRKALVLGGYNVSPVMDRMYFHSIYYREPGGVLFEIATDPPGFATDEAPEQLGERLMLPAWLEKHRGRIEEALPTLALGAGG